MRQPFIVHCTLYIVHYPAAASLRRIAPKAFASFRPSAEKEIFLFALKQPPSVNHPRQPSLDPQLSSFKQSFPKKIFGIKKKATLAGRLWHIVYKRLCREGVSWRQSGRSSRWGCRCHQSAKLYFHLSQTCRNRSRRQPNNKGWMSKYSLLPSI